MREMMKEDLLQFIWQFGKYNAKNLQTTAGEPVTVLKCGLLNRNQAGPDFLQARIKIGETEWAGNVEIHMKASDWQKHGHQNDKNYGNVILHVVFENDLEDFHIPTVELKDRVSNTLLQRYQELMINQQFVACEYFLPALDEFTWLAWKERLIAERLQDKTARISTDLVATQTDWQQTFYQQLAYNYGLKTNELAFHELAKRVPLKLIGKHKQNLLQIEALLFGTAGLIPENGDEYSQTLQREYDFLRRKYSLTPMSATNWNFGGVRPPSLPTVRIAQFASLLHHSSALFSKVMQVEELNQFKEYFSVKPSSYWLTHYTFAKESKEKVKVIGKAKLENIIINTIVPFQFFYGQSMDKPELVKNSFELLNQLPTEKNSIISNWKNKQVNCSSAFDSQALLHLYKNYCQPKKCLQCRVGHTIFTKN